MKKISSALLVLFVCSCGVQKSVKSDPYTGSYEMTVFEVDNIGDLPLNLVISKEGENYIAAITPRGEMQDVTFEIDSVSFEQGIFTIEAYAAGYDIYFELSIEGDTLSGSLMGMFDVEGKRVQTK
ncbi:MAG: hypothetical protein ACPIAA_02645 [Flavobacteriaceae bacterium]